MLVFFVPLFLANGCWRIWAGYPGTWPWFWRGWLYSASWVPVCSRNGRNKRCSKRARNTMYWAAISQLLYFPVWQVIGSQQWGKDIFITKTRSFLRELRGDSLVSFLIGFNSIERPWRIFEKLFYMAAWGLRAWRR